ncbi:MULTISPECIES: RcnB family protein [Phenylobacterium]|uniref:Ni/Co efflux regulator RcnB n=1 Tax=Phenylobacterium koreense TaxID=266125 RepID=A0ABV2EH28_9CAUL
MKKILSAAVALSILASAGVASAQPYHNNDRAKAERQYDRRVDKAERQYNKDVRKAERKYRAAAYKKPPGYQYRYWNRGDRLPPAYRAERYRITNYRTYHLPPPPRGYYYTRVDNDVVLTAAATGIITSVIVGLFQ